MSKSGGTGPSERGGEVVGAIGGPWAQEEGQDGVERGLELRQDRATATTPNGEKGAADPGTLGTCTPCEPRDAPPVLP